jgi:hypothetical protein
MNIKKRFFAFGCSYTYWNLNPTWADFIGINFEEYYNLGRPGACNTYIMNQFIETDKKMQFNQETDVVIIALTGFGRFSYLQKTSKDVQLGYEWITNGDILFKNPDHPEKAKLIANEIYNYTWAAYNSWIAISAIKSILSLKNIEHKIIMAIDNSHYLTDTDVLDLNNGIYKFNDIVCKIENIYDTLDITETIDAVKLNYNLLRNISNIDHPNKEIHFQYMSKHFPEFVTEKSKNLLNIDVSTLNWYLELTNRITNLIK